MEIQGYKNTANEREAGERAGGGLMAYWKEDFSLHPHLFEVDSNMKVLDTERQWLLLGGKNVNYAICNIYMRAEIAACPDFKIHNKQLIELITNEMSYLRGHGFHIIIMGDMNGHIGNKWNGAVKNNKSDVNTNGKLIIDFIKSNNLKLINEMEEQGRVFTREGRLLDGTISSESCLDLCLMDSQLAYMVTNFKIDCSTEGQFDSDHKMITCKLELIEKVNRIYKKPSVGYKILQDQDYTMYRAALRENLKKVRPEDFENLCQKDMIKHLHDQVLKSARWTMPSNKRYSTKKKVPNRLPADILVNVRLKQFLWAKIRAGDSKAQLREDHLAMKKVVKQQISDHRIKEKKKLSTKLLTSDPDRRTFWKIVRDSKRTHLGLTGLADSDGKVYFDPKNLTRIARESFKKRLNGSDVPVPAPTLPAPSRGNRGLGKIPNMGEVKKALNDLNNGKAKDPFGICFELLKEGGRCLEEYLLIWINKVFKEGEIDSSINYSRVSLIYKKGNPLDPENFRPISISSALSKLVTKIIVKRINWLLERFDLLSPFQFGFRANKSTQDALFCLSTCMEQAKIIHQDIHMAFIDIKSAYDKVDRTCLLKRCAETGLDMFSIGLLRSFYSEDSVFFEIEGAKSEKLFLREGVRQGCQVWLKLSFPPKIVT